MILHFVHNLFKSIHKNIFLCINIYFALSFNPHLLEIIMSFFILLIIFIFLLIHPKKNKSINTHHVYLMICMTLSISYSQSMQDIQSLRTEFERLRNAENLPTNNIGNDFDRVDSDIPAIGLMTTYESDFSEDEIENLFFGYNFFTDKFNSIL